MGLSKGPSGYVETRKAPHVVHCRAGLQISLVNRMPACETCTVRCTVDALPRKEGGRVSERDQRGVRHG